MFRLPKRALSMAVCLLVACLVPVSDAQPHNPESVTILRSGSTNRAGFSIEVNSSGAAEVTASAAHPEAARLTLSSALTARFFADLKAAAPLSSLPEVRCMKSASFGSSLRIVAGSEQTPDLSCGDGGNANLRDLIRDAQEIIALFEAK